MARALVTSNTLKGSTAAIGEIIAEGLTKNKVTVEVKDASEIENTLDLAGYDAYVFGSATYHGEMLQHMKRILFLSEKAKLKGKVGGAFGSFGWSGEAPGRIFNTMHYILGMDMVEEPLHVKSVKELGAQENAREYGCLIAQKLRTS